MSTQRCFAVLLCLACLLPVSVWATDSCGQAALENEHQDAATIQVLEHAWSVAFLRGDTAFERCLLTPDFTEITRAGSVKVLADELGLAAQNQGRNLPIPAIPYAEVLIHGDVAVAYLSVQRSKDGKTVNVYNADYYVWERDQWHAYFSQQTQF
jgi:hypothetical protein